MRHRNTHFHIIRMSLDDDEDVVVGDVDDDLLVVAVDMFVNVDNERFKGDGDDKFDDTSGSRCDAIVVVLVVERGWCWLRLRICMVATLESRTTPELWFFLCFWFNLSNLVFMLDLFSTLLIGFRNFYSNSRLLTIVAVIIRVYMWIYCNYICSGVFFFVKHQTSVHVGDRCVWFASSIYFTYDWTGPRLHTTLKVPSILGMCCLPK